MVDPFDENGPGGFHPEPGPEGEPTGELFDNPSAPGGVPPGEAEPAAVAPKTTTGRVTEFPPPPDSTTHDEPSHPIFPVVLGGAMIAALAIACFANLEAPKEPAPAGESTPAAVVAAPPPVNPLIDEVNGLQAQVDGFEARMKELEAKIEAMPKAASSEDLEKVQTQVAELSKMSKPDEALPKKVDDLDGRVGSIDKSLSGLHDQISSLQGDVKKIGEKAMTVAAAEPAKTDDAANPADVNVEDQAMSQGADLYAAGKYKEASDVFRNAAGAASNDARVWYYAALSNGMATNQWTGETVRLVTKGMEREKAGTPETAKIDQLFAKLPAKQKVWLDYYRKLAK